MEDMTVSQMINGTASFPIIRMKEKEKDVLLDDIVIVEHQIRVFINGKPFIDMTCSPYELRPLVLGFLYSEGYIENISDVKDIYMEDEGQKAFVQLTDVIGQGEEISEVTSYGKKNNRAMLCPAVELKPVDPIIWNPDDLLPLSEEYFKGSVLFQQTGGVHSCILTTSRGEVLSSCEDIGRHNALDKVVGMALQENADFSKLVLYTSGRVPVDMMKKIIRSRIPIVISHSAVTSQAIEMAREYKVTLIGFARNHRCNLYTGRTFAGTDT